MSCTVGKVKGGGGLGKRRDRCNDRKTRRKEGGNLTDRVAKPGKVSKSSTDGCFKKKRGNLSNNV